VRGLKFGTDNPQAIAPKSHPTWVRGLKLIGGRTDLMIYIASHPTWVRGLKSKRNLLQERKRDVAPYMGAWIEMKIVTESALIMHVAPYMGAWIEMSSG